MEVAGFELGERHQPGHRSQHGFSGLEESKSRDRTPLSDCSGINY